MRRAGLVLALALVGCEGKDLGALISPEPPPCVGEGCNPTCVGDACNPPPVCDPSQPDLVCGVGACEVTVPACDGDQDNVCAPLAAAGERCNDVDDDCDGAVDEGCDDDGDLYCDADMEVEGSPAVCPKGGDRRLDCDDADRARHPGRTEICDDMVDNNCDGLVDYLDFEGCTHITASFEDGDGLKVIEHGTSVRVRALITPPSIELSREWRVAAAVPDDHCRPEDVIIETPVETPEATQRLVGIVDDPTKLDCRYQLELLIEGRVADVLQVRMRNTRPIVSAIAGAVFDESTLVLTVAEGTSPTISATVPEDPDAPVTVRWDGTDADLLGCPAPCETASVRFAAPPAAGTYNLRVRAADSFDGIFRNRPVRVEVVPCVWVRVGGTGAGRGPGIGQALPDVGAALSAAINADQNICVAAGGTFTRATPLDLPPSVGLIGGFNGSGAPANNRATIRFTGTGRLRVGAGHAGRLRRLVLRAGPSAPLVRVADASPAFDGVIFDLSAGDGRTALEIEALNARTDVRLRSCTVRFSGDQGDATGISVRATSGAQAVLRTTGSTEIEVPSCSGTCRGVFGRGQVDVRLSGRVIDVEALGAGSRAHAVELRAEAGRAPIGAITGHAQITARTDAASPADATVGIQLFGARNLRIANNVVIGPQAQVSGRRFSAGVADGRLGSDGRVERGGSVGVEIEANRRIAAGRWTPVWSVAGCRDSSAPPPEAQGTEIGAGVLLVGTRSATVAGNGNNGSRDNAVFGGASSSAWRPSGARVLPPSVPGIWTVDTEDVRILNNEIRPGVLVDLPGCVPDTSPSADGLRDGLDGAVQDRLPSRGLLVEGNGVVTGRSGALAAAPNADAGSSRGVALLGGGTARLANNFIAMTRGHDLVGLYAAEAADLEIVNNSIELDLLAPMDDVAVRQRGIVLSTPARAAVRLFNTIVLLRDAGDAAPDPIAIELRGADAVPGLGRFEHNLLFVEAAQRDAAGTYVQIEGGARVTEADFPAFESVVGGQGTLLLPPLFQAHALEHRRSITRLTAASPAVDAGVSFGAPELDLFGDPRPRGGAVDIGHHELGP